jgi:hypothetical protein
VASGGGARRGATDAAAREQELADARKQLGAVEGMRRNLLEQGVLAAAAGRFADPTDALRMVDVSDVHVTADGVLDAPAVRAKLDALLQAKPYLAANRQLGPAPLPGGGGGRTPVVHDFNAELRAGIRGARSGG